MTIIVIDFTGFHLLATGFNSFTWFFYLVLLNECKFMCFIGCYWVATASIGFLSCTEFYLVSPI